MKITLIIFLLFITGCTGSIRCRHDVLSTALFAREQGKNVRINVYSIDDTKTNWHAQASYTESGKWIYLSQFAGFVFESENRSKFYYGCYADFSIEDYVKMLKIGKFDYWCE